MMILKYGHELVEGNEQIILFVKTTIINNIKSLTPTDIYKYVLVGVYKYKLLLRSFINNKINLTLQSVSLK